MKYLVAILFTYAVITAARPDYHKTNELEFNNYIDMCAAENGLLVEETRRSFSMPLEPPGNCIMACVWKKTGLMEPNGKIHKEEMRAGIQPALKELSNYTTIRENIFYDCVDTANKFDDGCTVVSQYFKCLLKDLLFSDNM